MALFYWQYFTKNMICYLFKFTLNCTLHLYNIHANALGALFLRVQTTGKRHSTPIIRIAKKGADFCVSDKALEINVEPAEPLRLKMFKNPIASPLIFRKSSADEEYIASALIITKNLPCTAIAMNVW